LKRLAIINTHPIQYNAPWFRLLAERKKIAIKVFYTWSQVQTEEKYDPGFGKNIEWDVPILDGYDYTFVKNVSKNPGSKTFRGIQNPTLIKEVEEWRADAVLVFGWKFDGHLRALKYFHKKIPVLFRGDSTLLDKKIFPKELIKPYILKNVFKHVDAALYVGSANKKYFQKAGMEIKQLFFAPHAIDNNRFAAAKGAEISGWPEKSEKKVTFLYAGKLEDKKDPILLLSVFAKQKYQHARLVVVGNGPLEKELKEKYGHVDNIYFLDFKNQQLMPSVYKNSDVFILPSKGPGETWGLAVNEAMACGKPVLVSDRCGCAADLVEEGKTGFTFRSMDAEDLKIKLDWMIQHRDELPNMGKRAYEKIQGWSFEKVVTAVEELVVGL